MYEVGTTTHYAFLVRALVLITAGILSRLGLVTESDD